jgi:hypothetical protein
VIAFILVMCALLALLVLTWIAIGTEPGPSAADVAIAYERAWDELNFDLLYDLSGDELRDGMRRERFVKTKRDAYEKADARHRIDADIRVETTIAGNQTALVVTEVAAHGSSVRNNLMLEKRANGWVVVGYTLRNDAAGSNAEAGDGAQ